MFNICKIMVYLIIHTLPSIMCAYYVRVCTYYVHVLNLQHHTCIMCMCAHIVYSYSMLILYICILYQYSIQAFVISNLCAQSVASHAQYIHIPSPQPYTCSMSIIYLIIHTLSSIMCIRCACVHILCARAQPVAPHVYYVHVCTYYVHVCILCACVHISCARVLNLQHHTCSMYMCAPIK